MSSERVSQESLRSGSLHLIVGCMYSGKTDELLKQIRVRRLSGKQVLLIKYAKDVRYSQRADLVSSHNGMRMDGALSRSDLLSSDFVPVDVDCIAIDEGQFFEGIEEFVRRFNSVGKIKTCARSACILIFRTNAFLR